MSSAICLNVDQSKILSSGSGLSLQFVVKNKILLSQSMTQALRKCRSRLVSVPKIEYFHWKQKPRR